MLYRSLILGLLGAIALLIAMLPGELEARRDARPAVVLPPTVGVVHVSRRALEASPLSFDQTIAGAVGLATGEQIQRIDLEIGDGPWTRRVVVVVEP